MITLSNKLLRGLLCLAAGSMLFTACDQATGTDNLEETMASVPHLNLVEGADQAVVTVNRDRATSNFSVTLDNVSADSEIGPGTYASFCALWDVSIDSNGGMYGDVKIHSIEDEPYWDGINYMVNRLNRYYAEYEELTWLDVQIAMWSVMDHKEFDLGTIPEEDLPGDVREGDYSIELVEALIQDVLENKDNFDESMAAFTAYYAEVPDAQDQIIIRPGADIDMVFGLTLQNFAVQFGGRPAIVQRHGGNQSGTSAQWDKGEPNLLSVAVTEPEAGRATFATQVTTNGSTSTHNQTANLPASCSFEEIDRMRVQIYAGDEEIEVTLRGDFMGANHEFTAIEGTAEDYIDYLVTGLDFTSGQPVDMELEFEGDNLSADGTSRVEIRFGCAL
jgi:hypothetical protein